MKVITKTDGKSGETAKADSQMIRRQDDPLNVLYAVLKLNHRLMDPFSTYLEKQYKITSNEFRILMVIGRYEKIASHEFVEMTGVNPMSVSRAVANLVKDSRIVVSMDPANKRRKILTLTAEGERLYEAMRPQTDRVANYLVSALTPAELPKFKKMVGKLLDALDAKNASGTSIFLESTKPPI